MSVAVAVFPNCGLHFPKFSAFTEAKLGISIFPQKGAPGLGDPSEEAQCQGLIEDQSKRPGVEHGLLNLADGTSPFACQSVLFKSPLWGIRYEGNGRERLPQRNNVSSRTAKGDKNQRSPQSSDGESSNLSDQEEIIALFRKIQSSISKSGSANTKKRSSDNHEKKQSTESVLDVLRQSRKQVKEDKVLPRRRRAPKKEARTKDNSSRPDVKLTRPPSNFVKQSPIPTPSIPKGKVVEVIGEGSPVEELESPRIEDMKLTELKELAKSRGIKGYSKLKKADLVALLKG